MRLSYELSSPHRSDEGYPSGVCPAAKTSPVSAKYETSDFAATVWVEARREFLKYFRITIHRFGNGMSRPSLEESFAAGNAGARRETQASCRFVDSPPTGGSELAEAVIFRADSLHI